jgi:dTMP kinase
MFVALEGIDGSGKTTLIKALREQGYTVTREPYLDVTKEILATVKEPLATELVFYLDRLYHLERVINPKRDINIITDRYKHSQIAYAYARYGETKLYSRVLTLNDTLPDPDLILLLDVPPKEALRRKPSIARDAGPYGDPLIFFSKVREKYLSMMDESWILINAHKSKERILEEVLECLSK